MIFYPAETQRVMCNYVKIYYIDIMKGIVKDFIDFLKEQGIYIV
jgi:hypothetical protein